MVEKKNILAELPDALKREVGETILKYENCRIERIVSHGQASPPGFWYDQEEGEWVLLLKGSAIITFEDGELELLPGDHIFIPPHVRHRVKYTPPDIDTVWICVFVK